MKRSTDRRRETKKEEGEGREKVRRREYEREERGWKCVKKKKGKIGKRVRSKVTGKKTGNEGWKNMNVKSPENTK